MIALTTPTGTIGSKTLGNLLASTNEPIRVLVRDRGRLPSGILERVEIVEGSLDEPGDLRRLLDGARTLFWCQPDPHTAPDYLGAYEALSERGCAAVRESGVPRVVAISVAGGKPDRPAGPISGLHRMEEIFRGSGAACRFLRCGSFFDNFLWQWHSITEQGVFVYPIAADAKGPQVAAADIARVAAGWLSREDWVGVEAPQLLGPEALSYGEMAEILARQLERGVAYERMEPAAYCDVLVSMGSSPAAAQGLVDMFLFLESGYHVPPDAVIAETPTTFAQWLRRDG
jgi:uncharacterized protein YbjT (DUF2867 family)